MPVGVVAAVAWVGVASAVSMIALVSAESRVVRRLTGASFRSAGLQRDRLMADPRRVSLDPCEVCRASGVGEKKPLFRRRRLTVHRRRLLCCQNSALTTQRQRLIAVRIAGRA